MGSATFLEGKTGEGDRANANEVKVTTDNQVAPLMTDRLVVGGVEHTITGVEVKNHAGIVQAYIISGRS